MTDTGFSIEQNVFQARDCDELIKALPQNRTRARAGARHLMANPKMAALARDHRLLQLARRSLGDGAIPFRATLFEKSARANWFVAWHQDTALPLRAYAESPQWGPWSTKDKILYAHAPAWALMRIIALRVYLDASKAENGPLRVVPGSHSAGVLTRQEVSGTVLAREYVDCLVDRGGVLVMRPLLIHSSSKAGSQEPRRVLHIEYADSIELNRGILLSIA